MRALAALLLPLAALLLQSPAALAAAGWQDRPHYVSDQPDIGPWISQLHAQGVNPGVLSGDRCCDQADAEDVPWTTDGGNYVIIVDGMRMVVPTSALVTVPNKAGVALAWIEYVWDLHDGAPPSRHPIGVRCFLPGAAG